MINLPPLPKIEALLTKAEALSYAARRLRDEVHVLMATKTLLDAVNGVNLPEEGLSQFKAIKRQIPEIDLQIKARIDAAEAIEAMAYEERLLAVRIQAETQQNQKVI